MILEWKRRLIFWGGAICVGLVAIFFAVACETANDLFHKLIAISPYLPLLLTPIGLVSIVIITRKYFPGSQGSGIPQAIASLDPNESPEIREQVLSIRIIIGKIFLTILGLMFGASVGREGPTVIFAGITSLALVGNYSYFGHTSASLAFGKEWYVVIVCGISGGFLGGVFSRFLIEVNKGLSGNIGVWMKTRPVAFAAICGLLLALIGLAADNTTYGSGYNEAKSLLNGSSVLPESYGLLKMTATIVSYVSGIPGGIMSPTLSAGAGFGVNIAHLFTSVPAGAVIILGMVAYFAGVTQAPITAFVIVMEMLDNHEMILPLMATSLIACACSRLICPIPLYYALAQNFIRRQLSYESFQGTSS